MAIGRIGTTPTLRTRWSKQPSGGTTSLSGLDDNSVSLVYDVGYEAVYRNGVLLSRGNDYTATSGTSITLIDATIAGDVIEVFANQSIPLTNTYTQTVADGKFINNTIVDAKGDIIAATAADTVARLAVGSNDQVLTADSSTATGLKWATPSSSFVGCLAYASNLSVSFTGGTATVINMANEEFDTDGFHSTTSNSGRITIPAGKGGKYLVTAQWDISGVSANEYYITRITKNGIALTGSNRGGCGDVGANAFQGLTYSTIVDLVATDYIDFRYQRQNSGTSDIWLRLGAVFLGA